MLNLAIAATVAAVAFDAEHGVQRECKGRVQGRRAPAAVASVIPPFVQKRKAHHCTVTMCLGAALARFGVSLSELAFYHHHRPRHPPPILGRCSTIAQYRTKVCPAEIDTCSLTWTSVLVPAGGIVLWSRSFTPAASQTASSSSSPVNSLVRDALIEGRTAENKYEKDGYAVRWTFVNDLELIFVVSNHIIVSIYLQHPEPVFAAGCIPTNPAANVCR